MLAAESWGPALHHLYGMGEVSTPFGRSSEAVDDDLLRNPLDEELKRLAQAPGGVLRPMSGKERARHRSKGIFTEKRDSVAHVLSLLPFAFLEL